MLESSCVGYETLSGCEARKVGKEFLDSLNSLRSFGILVPFVLDSMQLVLLQAPVVFLFARERAMESTWVITPALRIVVAY